MSSQLQTHMWLIASAMQMCRGVRREYAGGSPRMCMSVTFTHICDPSVCDFRPICE